MNSTDQDDIDALLRRSFDSVADEGFSDRVMQRLPPRRRASAWPLAIGIALGVLTCCISLFASALWRTGWRDWLHGELSASAIVMLLAMAGMSLLALGWMLAEAEDH
jgi:cytochrome bd-type quinol oxidase subunit 1